MQKESQFFFGKNLTILVIVVCYSQKHATCIRHRLVSLDTLFTIIFYIKKATKQYISEYDMKTGFFHLQHSNWLDHLGYYPQITELQYIKSCIVTKLWYMDVLLYLKWIMSKTIICYIAFLLDFPFKNQILFPFAVVTWAIKSIGQLWLQPWSSWSFF